MIQEHVAKVKAPLISIIIPTLNEARGIGFFLSHLGQFRESCEIVLVDGGSTDNTVDIATPLVDQLLISDAGRALQMNKGAAVAKSETLLFLHADTFLPKDAVGQIQLAMSQGYYWGRFNVRLLGQHYLFPIIAALMNFRSHWSGIATGDQAIFVNKTLFDKHGGYPQIPLMEDIALSKQLKKTAKPYCIASCIGTSARRWLKFGVVKTVLLMWWLRLQYFFGVDPVRLATLYREGRFWKP